MADKPIPFALYDNPRIRAQARMQGAFYGEDLRNEESRLSETDQALIAHMNKNQHVVKNLPPIRAGNLADRGQIVGLQATYIDLPYAELMKIAMHDEVYVRKVLALQLGPEQRHQKPAELLARDPIPMVRRYLAMNLYSSRRVLVILASDDDVWVRRRVAYHGELPTLLARRLLGDPDEDVRIAADLRLKRSGSL